VVQASSGRDVAFAKPTVTFGVIKSADRTLGGPCDWVGPEALRPIDLVIDGAAAPKAAVIPIALRYCMTDPLA
jgi:hypothetical protein